MTTLANVNDTLLEVSENTEKTSKGISAFLKYIEDQKRKDIDQRRKDLEAEREAKANTNNLAKAQAKQSSSKASGGGILGDLSPGKLLTGGGLLAAGSMLTKGASRLLVPGLLLAASTEAESYITSETGSKELGEATRRGLIGGGIGLIFGKKIGVIGALLGAAFTDENKKKLEELGESLKPAAMAVKTSIEEFTGKLPSMDEVLKGFQTSVGNALTGLTAIAKGDFSTSQQYLGDIAISAGALFTMLAPKSAFSLAMKAVSGTFNGMKSALTSGISAIGLSSKLGTQTASTLKTGSKMKITSGNLKGQSATFNAKTNQFHNTAGKMIKRSDVGVTGDQMKALKKFPRMAKFLKLGKVLGPLGSALGIAQLAMILAEDGPVSSKIDQIAGVFGGIGGGVLGAISGTAIGALATGPLAPIAAPVAGILGAIGGSLAGNTLATGLAQFLMGQKVDAFPWWTGLNKLLSNDGDLTAAATATGAGAQTTKSSNLGVDSGLTSALQGKSIPTISIPTVSAKPNMYNKKLKDNMSGVGDVGMGSGVNNISAGNKINSENYSSSTINNNQTALIATGPPVDLADQFLNFR